MTDNVPITAGTGTTIATDDVGGIQYQRVKATFGADGTATDVSATSPLPVLDNTRAPDVQVFTASGTWTKPAGAVNIAIKMWGGGGGGGSGRRGAAGTARFGGGGGGGGGSINVTGQAASLFTSTVAVTVGAGGTGSGAGVTVDNTDGSPGGNGGASTFGGYFKAGGGLAGAGGTATSGTGGLGGFGTSGGTNGGSSSATAQPTSVGSVAAQAGGGGAGGGISTGNVAFNGGAGAYLVYNTAQTPTTGNGGLVDSTLPTGGDSAPSSLGLGSGGSGGGAASITTTAQSAQSTGGVPGGGGGGGGASTNGSVSGQGNVGGAGLCIVTTTF